MSTIRANTPPDSQDEPSAAHAAATQLEAYFLRTMLAEVQPDGEGLVDGGFAGSTFKEMLNGALADKMAEAGGIGIAKMLEPQMLAHGMAEESALPKRPPSSHPAVATLSAVAKAAPAQAPSLARALSAYQATTSGAGAGTLTTAPISGRPTSHFGTRTDPIEGDARVHKGIDLAAPEGTPVMSAGGGVVIRSGEASGYGNLVVVDHGGGVQTRYGHLSRIDVKTGQHVDAGTPIGAVGQTGRATGPHLHLEVRRDGEAVDPEKEIPPLKRSEMRPNRVGGGR